MAQAVLTQIQWQPRGARATLPVVLIHDSSGLVFNYHLLEDLRRDVFGIEDPLFETDKSWASGIPEMAEAYASAVAATIGQGPIILGGWSLGGMIGIEMCRIMQKKSDIKVAGLVLIDTPNSQRWSLLGPEVIRYEPGIKSTSPWVRKCVEQRFKFADDLVDTWLFPSMADLTADSQLSLDDMGVQAFPIPKVKQSDSTTASDTARMTSLCTNQEFMNNMKLQYERGLLPPTMLLRAVEFAQDAIENTELRNRIDCDRDFPLLGWEQCPVKFISVVQDTAGNHYTMFDGDEKSMALTSAISTWCLLLDGTAHPRSTKGEAETEVFETSIY